jgi:hypothetical protein
MIDAPSGDPMEISVEISRTQLVELDRHIRRIRDWVDDHNQSAKAAHHLFTASAREQLSFVESAFALMTFVQDRVIKT